MDTMFVSLNHHIVMTNMMNPGNSNYAPYFFVYLPYARLFKRFTCFHFPTDKKPMSRINIRASSARRFIPASPNRG